VTKDFGDLYLRLGRLLESMPTTATSKDLRANEFSLWLGRGYVLVEETLGSAEALKFRVTCDQLFGEFTAQGALISLKQSLYRALAVSEAKAPTAMSGTFVPAGSQFDALAALGKVFREAKSDILIVDPYLDEVVLTDFAPLVPEGVALRLLADVFYVKPSLAPAVARWVGQYAQSRPLEARLTPPKALHDRAVFVDHQTVWTLTQSFRSFAVRSPAVIVRADDIAPLKLAAYEALWQVAVPT